MSKADLGTCYRLIEHTSRKHYEGSSVGWRPKAKMNEMKSPHMRYLLVRCADARDETREEDKGQINGFTSIMPTFEDGHPVLYCYEIHLGEEWQG